MKELVELDVDDVDDVDDVCRLQQQFAMPGNMSSLRTVMHDNITRENQQSSSGLGKLSYLEKTKITSSPLLHHVALVEGQG